MKYGIVVGRFQPFHSGHKSLLDRALSETDVVLVCVGSSNEPRTFKNPWTFSERCEMINRSLSDDQRIRVQFVPIEDFLYDDQKWLTNFSERVLSRTKDHQSITVFGHGKNQDTLYYLSLINSNFDYVEHNLQFAISGTQIRNSLFFDGPPLLTLDMPNGTLDYLLEFEKTQEYHDLSNRAEKIAQTKLIHQSYQFPPIFVSADAFVIHEGRLLLIKTKAGTYALPGGHVNHDETILDAAYRELKEETGLARSNVVELKEQASLVFDKPDRDERYRMITHVWIINAFSDSELHVQAGDDAAEAFWIEIEKFYNLPKNNFRADHWHIIDYVFDRIRIR